MKKTSSKDIQLSKSLSWLLRHGANSVGLIINDDGYVDLESILQLKQFRSYSISDITRIVENNDKKRFSLRETNDKLQIRANQGHSIPLSEENLLSLLTVNDLPENVIHGTFLKNWNRIKTEGISRMNRNHIHFSPGFADDPEVISGIRKNCQVTIIIDAKAAINDGIKFYLSENNVILSPGNEYGLLPPIYFKEVIKNKTKEVLYPNS